MKVTAVSLLVLASYVFAAYLDGPAKDVHVVASHKGYHLR